MRLSTIFLGLLLATGPETLIAQSTGAPLKIQPKELATCASITNEVKRLDCYDLLAKKHGQMPMTKATTATGQGKWETLVNTDPLTDKSVYHASLTASQGKGRLGKPITLHIRCQNDKTDAYIVWNSFLGSDSISVTSRIDKLKAESAVWSISTDHMAAFMPNAVSTLRKLVDAQRFVANLTPYSESPVTAIFDITGANRALTDIRRSCQWLEVEKQNPELTKIAAEAEDLIKYMEELKAKERDEHAKALAKFKEELKAKENAK